jgi:hypothetical protein
VLERQHLNGASAAERGQALSLVERLGVTPRNLEHDLAPVGVDSRCDPGAVATRLERGAEVQGPPRLERLDPLRQCSEPRRPFRPTGVRRGLQVGRHAQRLHRTTYRTRASAPQARPTGAKSSAHSVDLLFAPSRATAGQATPSSDGAIAASRSGRNHDVATVVRCVASRYRRMSPTITGHPEGVQSHSVVST